MTDPTPRPPVGTDPAPCPACGGDIDTKASEDSDGQWWDLDCPGCGWCAYEVEYLAPFTLAGAPWTRALWAEVERLRAEAAHRDTWAGLMEQLDRHYPADLTQEGAVLDGPGGAVVRMAREVERLRAELAELRLDLAAKQGRQEGRRVRGGNSPASGHGTRRAPASPCASAAAGRARPGRDSATGCWWSRTEPPPRAPP